MIDVSAGLLTRLARRHAAQRVEPVTLGRSPDRVDRLVRPGRTDLFCKQAGAHPASVDDETVRLQWLAGTGIGCPEVVDAGPGWLLTVRLRGRDAAQPWAADDRPYVLDTLTALHALDPATCPFPPSLPDHRLTERRVVTHGDFCCPNVLIDPGGAGGTGVIDIGGLGVADPYLDLATTVMTLRDLNPQYGGVAAVERVFARYGADMNDPRIEDYLERYHAAGD